MDLSLERTKLKIIECLKRSKLKFIKDIHFCLLMVLLFNFGKAE